MQPKNGHHARGNGSHTIQDSETFMAFAPETIKRPPPPPEQGEILDVILRMHSDLVEYGQRRAEVSRDVEVNLDDLAALEEHASAMAEDAYREPYDPSKSKEHELREAEFKKLQHLHPEAELQVNYAAADAFRLEEERAAVKSQMTAPTVPQVLMISAVAGLSLTIAPTLHDYVFITMSDDVLNWAISLLSATVYGVFITWGILEADDASGRRSVRNWLGLVGGIGVPVGLGILRVANATGGGEILFAVALTIVEVGIVLLLESRARTLRVAYQEWAAQQAALKDVNDRLEAAAAHLELCRQRLAQISAAITAHIRHVEELAVRNFNIEKIRKDAVRAVRDGYFAGLAANRGYLRGGRRGG